MTAAVQTAPELLTVPEAAALMRMQPKSVYAMIAEGRLPGIVRIGRLVRFNRAKLVAWLSSDDQRLSRPRRSR